MSQLANRVLFKDLPQPTRVLGAFAATRQDSADEAWRGADRLCRSLDAAGVRFAAVDEDPIIKVHVTEGDFPRLEESGIKLRRERDF